MGFLEIAEDVGHWVGERVDDLGKFVSAALYGNTGAEAVPAPELARKVLEGPGTSVWHEGARQAVQLGGQHHEASDLVSRMSTGLESAWTGRAADAAQTRIRALAEIASVSAAIYTTNGANLSDVAHGFDAMKTSLQPMPDQPPHLTFLDRISPWETDAEKEINQYNAVAQQNIDRYQAYVQHSRTGGQQLQTDYGRLDDFGGRSDTAGAQMKAWQGPDEAPHFPKPRSSWYPPDAPPTFAPPVSGPSAPPTQGHGESPGPSVAPPRTADQTTTSGWTPDPATAKAPPTTGGSGSGSTTASEAAGGFPLQGGNPSREIGRTGGKSEALDRTGAFPWPGTGGGTSEEARGRTPQPGTGAGQEARGRTSRPGTGAGEGSPTTPTRNAPGTPGSRGAPGVGGMPPTRGKDEKSQEHHRKYGVDNDSAFSLTDDDGERTVDPRTGLPPTPPTIGG